MKTGAEYLSPHDLEADILKELVAAIPEFSAVLEEVAEFLEALVH
jgi:hypothetical protein